MIETNRHAVLEFLRTRRSPSLRSLVEPGPDAAQLEAMLTIASRVPDHGKLVPWRYIVIQGERAVALGEMIGTIFDAKNPDATDSMREEARRRLSRAPVVVAVVSRPVEHPRIPEWEQVLTAGAVCMNLLNVVKASGFAGVWLTEWYAFDAEVTAELGLAAHERIAGFIHIGTDDAPREDRVRPALAEIVTTY